MSPYWRSGNGLAPGGILLSARQQHSARKYSPIPAAATAERPAIFPHPRGISIAPGSILLSAQRRGHVASPARRQACWPDTDRLGCPSMLSPSCCQPGDAAACRLSPATGSVRVLRARTGRGPTGRCEYSAPPPPRWRIASVGKETPPPPAHG